jgi:hypothetical protein
MKSIRKLFAGALTVMGVMASIAPAHALVGSMQYHALIPLNAVFPPDQFHFPNTNSQIVVSNRQGTGIYRVDFVGSSAAGAANTRSGNVQVVAVGNNNRRCAVASWTKVSTADHIAFVECTTPNGTLADSAFAISFIHYVSGNGVRSAYLGNFGTSTTPTRLWASWNSTGYRNTLTKLGTGLYQARLEGLGMGFDGLGNFAGGTVQVTSNNRLRHCKVEQWNTAPDRGPRNTVDKLIRVRCFDTSGRAADSNFSLVYEEMSKGPIGKGAHIWSHDPWSQGPSTACVTANKAFDFNSATTGRFAASDSLCQEAADVNGTPATGVYRISHNFLSATHSIARVTAYGSSSSYCKLQQPWGTEGATLFVRTRCFNAAGNSANSAYVENYITWR